MPAPSPRSSSGRALAAGVAGAYELLVVCTERAFELKEPIAPVMPLPDGHPSRAAVLLRADRRR